MCTVGQQRLLSTRGKNILILVEKKRKSFFVFLATIVRYKNLFGEVYFHFFFPKECVTQ